MPLPNRVDPFSSLRAVPERGTLMGNRGRLHDSAQRLIRDHRGIRWISCRLDFRGRRREVWAPGRYSELFFLDEATALAAGHRPCAECRRDRVAELRIALGVPPNHRVSTIDEQLHRERLTPDRRPRRHPVDAAAVPELPNGTMVSASTSAWLVVAGGVRRWTPAGYDEVLAFGAALRLWQNQNVVALTPPTLIKALANGYPLAA